MSEDNSVPPDGLAESPDTQRAATGIPPYISFKTLQTFFKELKTNGLPPQIDNSVLKRFSGGIQGQLKVALKYLGLVEDSKPTPTLAAMVEAFETPQFNDLLAALLRERYPFVFALDLMTATPTMFADAFKVTGAKEDVSRKCRTFFLHAAKEAAIPLGQRIQSGVGTRASPATNGRRKPRAAKPKDDTAQHIPDTPRDENSKPEEAFMGKLLGKFPEFDPQWPDNIKAKWFENFETFMKVATTK